MERAHISAFGGNCEPRRQPRGASTPPRSGSMLRRISERS